jgi:PAT family beta-lactamase induction signal transducer AmpG
VLDQREVGAGASVWVLGYRIALIVTGSLAFILADRIEWPMVYLVLAMLMIVGIVTSFWAPEPVLRDAPPRDLSEAVYLPFREFFTRPGAGAGFALVILLFVIFYRYADYLAGNMTTPFLLQIGFSQSEIGVILGGIGLGATIVGVLIGGAVIGWIGLNRALWIFLVLQATTNLVYYWLAVVGANRGIMTVAILIENVTAGLVTAVLLGYLMSVCDKRFSATQFALLSSLTAASRDIIVAPAGWLAEALGWQMFFVTTMAAALPALVLLPFIAPWNSDTPRGAAAHTGETTE